MYKGKWKGRENGKRRVDRRFRGGGMQLSTETGHGRSLLPRLQRTEAAFRWGARGAGLPGCWAAGLLDWRVGVRAGVLAL